MQIKQHSPLINLLLENELPAVYVLSSKGIWLKLPSLNRWPVLNILWKAPPQCKLKCTLCPWRPSSELSVGSNGVRPARFLPRPSSDIKSLLLHEQIVSNFPQQSPLGFLHQHCISHYLVLNFVTRTCKHSCRVTVLREGSRWSALTDGHVNLQRQCHLCHRKLGYAGGLYNHRRAFPVSGLIFYSSIDEKILGEKLFQLPWPSEMVTGKKEGKKEGNKLLPRSRERCTVSFGINSHLCALWCYYWYICVSVSLPSIDLLISV